MPAAGGNIEKEVRLKLIADPSQYEQGINRATSGTQGYSKSIGDLNSQLTGLRQTMGGIAQQFGAGAWGNLLAAGSLAGATIAVAGIIAQAVRMAYVFQETSARVAANLTIGTGTSVGSAWAQVQAATTNPAMAHRYGYGPLTQVQGLSAYQAAAGADLNQTLAAQRVILASARAYGLTPEETGSAIGGMVRVTGETAERAAGGLFGGAAQAGLLGRDIRSFIGTATSVLMNLAMGAPNQRVTVAEAAGYVANITRAGGVYQTPQGVQAVQGALSALTQGAGNDPMRLSLGIAAGIPFKDILLGTDNPRIEAQWAREIMKVGGGPNTIPTIGLLTQIIGQGPTKMLLENLQKNPNLLDEMMKGKSMGSIIPMSDIDKRAMSIMQSPYGDIAGGFAQLETAMIKMGSDVIKQVDKLLLNGKALSAAEATIKYLPEILGALVIADIAVAGKGLLGLFGKGAGLTALAGDLGAGGLLGSAAVALLGGVALGGGTVLAGRALAENPVAIGIGNSIRQAFRGKLNFDNPLLAAISQGEGSAPWEYTGGADARANPYAHPANSNALGYFQFLSTTAQGNVPSWFTKKYGSLTDAGGNWNVGSKAWYAWINDTDHVQEATAMQHAAGLMAYYNKRYGAKFGMNNPRAVFAGWLEDTPGIDALFQNHPDAALKSYVDQHYQSYLDDLGKLDMKPSVKKVKNPHGRTQKIIITVPVAPDPQPGPGPNPTRTNSINYGGGNPR